MKNGDQDMVSINGNFGFFEKKNKAAGKPAGEAAETKETIPVAEGKPQTKEISEARMKELMELEAEQVNKDLTKHRFLQNFFSSKRRSY